MKAIDDISTSGIVQEQFISPGDKSPSYEPMESLGFNQLGKVKRQGKWFLLKGLKPEFRRQVFFLELLKKEYELMSQLDHPNIVKSYAKEMNEKLGPCIVMEYIDGMTLDQFLESKPSYEARRKVIDQLVDALTYIHGKQILHRDLKPSNILIMRSSNNVKIIDFGLSDADDYVILKQSAGTLKYMAPEQLEHHRKIDCRADIYAFGLMLRKLFPYRYRSIVTKCTRKDPDRRYSNMESVRKAIERQDRWIRWLPMQVMGAVMILLLVLAIRPHASLDLRKDVNEANRCQELLYSPMKMEAQKGEGYQELFMENLSRKTLEMNELLDEMSVRYRFDDEKRGQFKSIVSRRQRELFQEVSNAISKNCKSYKEELRLGHLSQREYDSLEWLVNAMVTTLPIENVTAVSAIGGAEVGSRFGEGLECGLCWSTSHSPSTRSLRMECLDGQPAVMGDLEPATAYYVRAYLSTPAGTVYGNEIVFTTLEGDELLPEGAIGGRFSVAPDRQVWFSRGNTEGLCRSLSADEWMYLLFLRNTASGYRFVSAMVADRSGMILLPDRWKSSNYAFNMVNELPADCRSNMISMGDWTQVLEPAGAVFLPLDIREDGWFVGCENGQFNDAFSGQFVQDVK